MWPVWLFSFWAIWVTITFENAFKRKNPQVQCMWLSLFFDEPFKVTHEETWKNEGWRKAIQMRQVRVLKFLSQIFQDAYKNTRWTCYKFHFGTNWVNIEINTWESVIRGKGSMLVHLLTISFFTKKEITNETHIFLVWRDAYRTLTSAWAKKNTKIKNALRWKKLMYN